MAATFMQLHKTEKKIIKALELLEPEDRKKVLAAVLALYGDQK